jgi:nitronate monooxygenase
MWPDNDLIDLLQVELPVIQAPMAGASGADLAVAVCEAGGLGSLPCAMLRPAEARAAIAAIRERTTRPLNVNFFCHREPGHDLARDRAWAARLAPYYAELGLTAANAAPPMSPRPFDAAMCDVVEDMKPEVVSFHFGLPGKALVERVRACGAIMLGAATTVREARWLEDRGCDAIIAQGCEAGGHRGMFLTQDIATQPGTLALVPQVVDAVSVPVIAAGGIADGRGMAAAFALGAAGVQIGTAYLLTPESLVTELHRAALRDARDDLTALTNVFSGRPARGLVNRVMREVGPMSDEAPAFPKAGAALAPLKAEAEARGSSNFSSLWSGQGAALAREMGAGELTRRLAADARHVLMSLAR